MAIGTGLALLGSAAISAGTGLLSSKSQSKAAAAASNITAADNAANRAFQQGIYNQNVGYLAPWMTRGNASGNAIMELLGYGQQAQPSAFASYGSAPGYAGGQAAFGGPQNQGPLYYGDPGMPGQAGQQFWGGPDGTWPGYQGAPGSLPGMATTPSARSAFDTYRGSTGYDFRFNEGMRGLQSAFSRNLESGAASKAAMRFGQGIASDEFSNYYNMLNQQNQLGFGAGSALAGVGQNFANSVVSGNQAAASAAANARLYSGASTANMWNNLGSSFGQALGAFKW